MNKDQKRKKIGRTDGISLSRGEDGAEDDLKGFELRPRDSERTCRRPEEKQREKSALVKFKLVVTATSTLALETEYSMGS